jgi:hypothetical protein
MSGSVASEDEWEAVTTSEPGSPPLAPSVPSLPTARPAPKFPPPPRQLTMVEVDADELSPTPTRSPFLSFGSGGGEDEGPDFLQLGMDEDDEDVDDMEEVVADDVVMGDMSMEDDFLAGEMEDSQDEHDQDPVMGMEQDPVVQYDDDSDEDSDEDSDDD